MSRIPKTQCFLGDFSFFTRAKGNDMLNFRNDNTVYRAKWLELGEVKGFCGAIPPNVV